MKIVKVLGIIVVAFIACQSFFSSTKEEVSISNQINKNLSLDVDTFSMFIQDSILPLLAAPQKNEQKLQSTFLQARLNYKKMEWATEYFMYSTARLVNGIPVPEAEVASQMILQPAGLQVIETYLFPQIDTTKIEALKTEYVSLLEKSKIFKRFFDNIDIADWQILDACKLELFRIETLGITGFDNALTLRSASESADALKGVKIALDIVVENSNYKTKLDSLVNYAVAYLNQNTNFNSLDRAYFIRKMANPITIAISDYVNIAKLPDIRYNRLLNQDAKTLFDSNAFNRYAFSPDLTIENESAKIELGRKLFNETAFSLNNTRSCASCHQAERQFADGLPKHLNIDNNGFIDRNAPSLINAALQPFQFYDFRSVTLEDQISNVVANPKEMHGSIVWALNKLKSNIDYVQLFQRAFAENPNATIDTTKVITAIATYERSLTNLNSRFDQYMRGNNLSLNSAEIKGFNIFMGKAQCATCHYLPLFSGVVPPKFINMDAEVIGVPSISDRKKVDPDLGLYNYLLDNLYPVSQLEDFKYAFKTTSIRNVSKSAPYMHNGVFQTIDEVLDFYNKGGGVGLGFNLPNQTLSAVPLNLTPSEILDLKAFIFSLDSLPMN
ncbi:cytochrome-c peroxidase [Rhizosphaericola mali]|uniref:Cytochrome C peroxidase n=1 Tax=Rhizosphaericola mali TaxID=2545455 RepID=A0A5P2G5N9_9BACT|nr:cytochrome c peroxidase [Rhizosphaericola mali]QES90855.1 cytochrome C peroxidase [Rhizosphaericola mali]